MISQILQPLFVRFVAGNCCFIVECVRTFMGCETFCTGKNQHAVIVDYIQTTCFSFYAELIPYSTWHIMKISAGKFH